MYAFVACTQLTRGVKHQLAETCALIGTVRPPWVSCRVTQVYGSGACVYFYFAVLDDGIEDVPAALEKVGHRLTRLQGYG